MKLDVLTTLLEEAGIASVGTDLFLHWMPEVKNGILIRLPLEGVPINNYLPGFHHHALQVIVRDTSMESLIERCDAVVAALTIKAETQFDGMQVKHLRPKFRPSYYPRSVSGTVEGSINFDCCYVLG